MSGIMSDVELKKNTEISTNIRGGGRPAGKCVRSETGSGSNKEKKQWDK